MFKKIFLTFIMLFCLIGNVNAYELLMFSNPSCSYCQAFLKEVKPTYNDSEYAHYLPLKVITMRGDMPKWIAKAFDEGRLEPISNTPTFVIWDDKEVARLIGYGGKEHFYESLSGFVESNQEQFKTEQPMTEGSHKNEFSESDLPPEGVINSRDIFAHTYKTPEEALKASYWLQCMGNVHYHKEEKVWMPCSMN